MKFFNKLFKKDKSLKCSECRNVGFKEVMEFFYNHKKDPHGYRADFTYEARVHFSDEYLIIMIFRMDGMVLKKLQVAWRYLPEFLKDFKDAKFHCTDYAT